MLQPHSDPSPRFAPPAAHERSPLLRWLGEGLRPGRPGRLEAEYAWTFRRADLADHSVAWVGDRPVAHSLASVVEARAAGRSGRIGLIGSVYSDPAERGRGFARGCVERAVQRLAAREALLALLWTDLDDFYGPLGFDRVGCEWLDWIDMACVERALRRIDAPEPLTVELPRDFGAARPGESDWREIAALHAAKPERAERASAALRTHAQAPDCETFVARDSAGRPVAYASCGRGDDFAGVVHEWAGTPSGILGCLRALLPGRIQLGLLSGPTTEPLVALLRDAGSQAQRRDLGLVRVLDAGGLWRSVTAGEPALDATGVDDVGASVRITTRAGRSELSRRDFGRLILGKRSEASPSLATTPEERAALSRCLPWPLFLWGFDSL